jgi:acyl-coenzyme A synthetase/AMP-(fatty) acid ligase/aryl carrier-like protein
VPKAVEGRHGALTHFLPWTSRHFGLGPDDTHSMLSALTHDPLQRDMFNALCLGGRLAVPHPDSIGPRRLALWLAESGVTIANLTPATARLACEDAATTLPALRHVFLVGDALARQDVERLHALAPHACVTNLYGATETQRALAFLEIERGRIACDARAIVPIGRAMPGAQLLVLDAAGAQAGIGEPGEIHVRSPHLARGYRDDDTLTARRFLANPAGTDPRDRLYRTGDIGRVRPDGSLDCLGRIDTQVKLRGFRIELGAIEAALAACAPVREAVAVIRGEGLDERQIVAYVVPRQEAPDVAALREALRTRLPAYMLPAAIVVLDRLPLTPNGKVDRAALPAPAPAHAEVGFAAPRTLTQARLAAIWAGVLQREAVGVADDFFACGGHSLRAAQAVARIRDEFGIDLPLRQFFERPTIAALADLIDADARDFDEIEL